MRGYQGHGGMSTYAGVYEDRTTELVVLSVVITGLMVYLIMHN